MSDHVSSAHAAAALLTVANGSGNTNQNTKMTYQMQPSAYQSQHTQTLQNYNSSILNSHHQSHLPNQQQTTASTIVNDDSHSVDDSDMCEIVSEEESQLSKSNGSGQQQLSGSVPNPSIGPDGLPAQPVSGRIGIIQPPKVKKVVRKDKAKHNESESRRRSRLRAQFMELRNACLCVKKDRFSILQTAIQRFKQLDMTLKQQQMAILQSQFAQQQMTREHMLDSKSTILSQTLSPQLFDEISMYPIFDCIPTAFVSLDGKVKDVNDPFVSMFESAYSKQFLLQQTLFTIIHPTELVITFQELKRVLSSECDCFTSTKTFVVNPNHSSDPTSTNLITSTSQFLPLQMTCTVAKRHGKAEFYVCWFVKLVPSPRLSPTPIQPEFAFQQYYPAAQLGIPNQSTPISAYATIPSMTNQMSFNGLNGLNSLIPQQQPQYYAQYIAQQQSQPSGISQISQQPMSSSLQRQSMPSTLTSLPF